MRRFAGLPTVSLFGAATAVACLPGPSGPGADGDGCPGASYPDWGTSAYVLPYPVGMAYRTGLTNCGGSYHSQGLPDAFAVDFDMPIGSLVTVSRPGVVAYVEEGGQDYSFPNNLVVVDHGDGSFGEYMHLTESGALVEVGDSVQLGDAIGYSGATGLAGYPHLHFVVARGDFAWPYESMPVNFRNTEANPRGPAGGTVYEAKAY
ncbi:MAG: M23 family metallopeptidase [Gemmatimonadota bacterium]